MDLKHKFKSLKCKISGALSMIEKSVTQFHMQIMSFNIEETYLLSSI